MTNVIEHDTLGHSSESGVHSSVLYFFLSLSFTLSLSLSPSLFLLHAAGRKSGSALRTRCVWGSIR